MKIAPKEFERWMRAIHGFAPFPWQQRLLEHVLESGWPSTLRLPTSSGKTAAMDVALFALACELSREEPRSMPLRIAFVVDRRIVVDGAYERALRIQEALRTPDDEVVAATADILNGLGAPEPLHVALLRGGIYREDRWSRQPNQPTVVCSTVDQVGSRLLHRGYGVSPRTWPIHAGLLANDTLILLDEAHCSAPFHATLDSIASLRCKAEKPLTTPWFVTSMTATPRSEDAPFELSAKDRENPVLRQRLGARKPIELAIVAGGNDKAFARELVAQTEPHIQSGRTLLIVANRVASARAAHDELSKRRNKRKEAPDLLLLTGRSRSAERDQILASQRSRLLAGRDRDAHADSPCLIVIATQCVEVGADLDVDLLVTEACPLDSLRQRLGRLNRLGELADSRCVIVARKEQAWGGIGSK